MKLQTIKIPDTTADMTMKHLPFFFALLSLKDKPFEELSPVEVADMLCIFFDEKPESFDKYKPESNKRLLGEIAISCAKHKANDIPKSYNINGTTYNWVSDYSKVNTAFHRDIANCDFQANPLDLLAFCYIEEGMTYNQLDKSEQIINPRRERGEAFREHINLAMYLDIQSFFLSSYPVLKRVSQSLLSTVRNAQPTK